MIILIFSFLYHFYQFCWFSLEFEVGIIVFIVSIKRFTCRLDLHGVVWVRSEIISLVREFICVPFKAIFIKFLFFHQMIALQKLRKMLFISSKKLFSSWDLQIFVFLFFPYFLPVGHCFRGWSKINIKVYDIINCLHKNSVTYFVWYLEKEKRYDNETFIDEVSDKEHFYRKTMQKMYSKS